MGLIIYLFYFILSLRFPEILVDSRDWLNCQIAVLVTAKCGVCLV